jgi:hypothetical protein
MPGRPLLTRLLLVLALLGGQQAVLAHAVSHLAQSLAQDGEHGLPHGKGCAHLLSPSFSSALPSSATILPAEVEACPRPVELTFSHRAQEVLGFRPRAPPINL